MPETTVAHYRLRLFLSVDLTNSTAFKFRDGGIAESIDAETNRPRWLVITTKFYSEFLAIFSSRFKALCHAEDMNCANVPKVWKTVGDEIIFVMTVMTAEETSLCVTAFMEALFRYRETLKSSVPHLDVQGAGWIAAFPAPNSTINPALLSGEEQLLFNPTDEDEADKEPNKFDFLGTAVDTGFRVAQLSRPAYMPITLELALILTQMAIRQKFSPEFLYDGRTPLKGVMGDRPYPAIFIDTETVSSRRLVASREGLLTGRHTLKPQTVHDFIAAFMSDEKIECPYFEGSTFFPGPPDSYNRFATRQVAALSEIAREDQQRYDSQISAISDQEESDQLPDQIADRLQGRELVPAPQRETVLQPERETIEEAPGPDKASV